MNGRAFPSSTEEEQEFAAPSEVEKNIYSFIEKNRHQILES